AKLNHRNVVSVFDQGTDGEVTYLVMEYVPGHTLRDVMRDEAPMPPYRALELLEQVLVALSAAHAAKIIHRDVKPENVLITPDGDVKVADFGLARAVSAATTATGGTLIGTVSYLAPEIVTNDGADPRSDVYACGAMLYEMLTGVKPHAGESPIQVAYKHVHEDIGAPSDVQRGIPPYVDALVARATVRDRDRRSTDARVMLQQVRSVQRALDAGLDDDPELVADLLPGGRVDHDATAPTVTVRRELMGPPAGAAAATEVVDDGESTMQWSNEVPAAAARGAAKPLGLDPPMSREQYGQATSNPHSRKGRNLLIGALVLAVLIAGLTWYVTDLRYDDTPVLVGSAEAIARQQAEAQGFVFEAPDDKRVFSEDAERGTVISTDPGPGDKILPGGTITAVISKGKERYYLPANNLRNMTVEDAKDALAERRLVLGKQTAKFDEKIRKGRIIGPQNDDVTPKTAFRRGQSIDVFVSKGRQPIAVKDFTGTSADTAAAELRSAGFAVTVSEDFSDDVDKGIVISQDPRGGTGFKGQSIQLVVSNGPDVVKVPDVVGKTKSQARSILTRAGFDFYALYLPLAGNFVVRNQSPEAGDRVKRGTRVSVSPL
ncbi:MAG: pknB, partial [Aeromicrobium sp.]|nr:pknB [Aeromicrobium sp.]